MEESYTVHRRRKAAAAARKREKTPEPSSRPPPLDTSEDEEEARRARMERMAEDAEQHEKESRRKAEEPSKPGEPGKPNDQRKNRDASPRSETLTKSPDREEASCPVAVSVARGNDAAAGEVVEASVKKSSKPVTGQTEEAPGAKEPANDTPEQSNEAPEPRPKSKETEDAARASEPRKAERRLKKKSKERLERHSRSTDSSDMEDRAERSPRRTKSPEGARLRVRKPVAKTRVPGDPETLKREPAEKAAREKRHSSRPKREESVDPREREERSQSRKHSHAEDTDEEKRMRKSETFPRRSVEEPRMKRSSTEVKKQIIPLTDDSLIQEFAKAQREYLMRERNILDGDSADVFQDAREEQRGVRRRKISRAEKERDEPEEARVVDTVPGREKSREPEAKKRSWFSWIPFLNRGKDEKYSKEKKEEKAPELKEKAKGDLKEEEKVKEEAEATKEEERREDEGEEKPSMETSLVEVGDEVPKKATLLDFFRALKDVAAEFRAFVEQNPRETRVIRLLRNRCVSELLAMMIYCGLGAFVFRFTEGAFETFYKCGVKRVKRDFLDSLWNYSHNLREEDWKSMARRKLMEFEEQLHTAHEAGVHSYSGQRSWSFLNAVVYCLTVVTTIGYGHISPSTTTGRAITIVYAIFGIPMFLIVLADFGKLFTRGIKFLWAFVRRLYYTGSCRKVRRTVPVQEVMKGVQLVYDFATFRRPSQMNPEDIEEMQRQAQQSQTVLNLDGNVPPDTPGTPAMSAFAIDDEFNLPISVAIFILLGYIFVGATLYHMWEDWGFFESFYFVFISMSTIGFGDYVPKHPIYMMCSIIYLVFGLALTSMCINVVQVMLSDSFKQASQKIGATIGFEIAEDDGSVKPTVEVADVHTSLMEAESVEKIAPRAKQEDVDL